MPVNLDDIGIQSYETPVGAICESLDYEKKLDEAVIMNCTSQFGAAEAFDPIIEFSVKGRGDLPVNLVVGTNGGGDAVLTNINDDIGGTIILSSVKENEKNDDFNGWEISGTFYPSVTPPA